MLPILIPKSSVIQKYQEKNKASLSRLFLKRTPGPLTFKHILKFNWCDTKFLTPTVFVPTTKMTLQGQLKRKEENKDTNILGIYLCRGMNHLHFLNLCLKFSFGWILVQFFLCLLFSFEIVECHFKFLFPSRIAHSSLNEFSPTFQVFL